MEEIIWKISEVNSSVRQVVEGGFVPFWIEGEIGTLTIHRSGHVYFVLKDIKSQIRAVFWRGAEFVRKMHLVSGTKIEAFGELTVYETRGEYQFNIKSIRTTGLGDLQRKFEEVKLKLSAEGLFDESRKKPIPLLPRSIGVITSSSGAAIRDFLNIINRRFPNIHISIYPALVQGKGAELKVTKGIHFFNKFSQIDVIVVTRGGGSMEDLWPFNSEILARTISESKIPIISAVGHEIDFTICDFVADMRVPTPSAAAELVIGCREDFQQNINDFKRRLFKALELYSERLKRRHERATNSYVFKDPARIIKEKQQYVDDLYTKISHSLELKLEREKNKFDNVLGRLRTLSPDSILKRGYSIITFKNSKKVITSSNVPAGTEVNAILKDGILDLVVTER